MRSMRQASGAKLRPGRGGSIPGGFGDTANIAKGMRELSKVMRRLAVSVAAIQVVMVGFGVAGMTAAGRMEMLKLQMANLSFSAEHFKNQWKQTMRVFLTSPLELEPVAKARTLLTGFGVEGEHALRNVASAAAAMQRPVDDIVRAIGSMETESFRRLAIEVRKTGEQFKFSFMDKGGKSLSVVANGMKEARQAAIEIMGIKFGGALELAAKTWEGAMSTFKGVRMFGLAAMFDPIKRRLVPQLMLLNNWILKVATNGTLNQWGEKVVAGFERVIEIVINTNNAIAAFSDRTGINMKNLIGIFVAVGVAFGSGLALPIIKFSLMAGSVFMTKLAIPMVGAIAMIAGAITALNVAKALDQAFDITGRIRGSLVALRIFATAVKGVFPLMGQEIERGLMRPIERINVELASLSAKFALLDQFVSKMGKLFDAGKDAGGFFETIFEVSRIKSDFDVAHAEFTSGIAQIGKDKSDLVELLKDGGNLSDIGMGSGLKGGSFGGPLKISSIKTGDMVQGQNPLESFWDKTLRSFDDSMFGKAMRDAVDKHKDELHLLTSDSNRPTFSDAFKKNMEDSLASAMKMYDVLKAQVGDSAILGEIQKLIEDLKNIGVDFKLPEMAEQMPDFGAGVKKGAEDGTKAGVLAGLRHGGKGRVARNLPGGDPINKLQANAVNRVMRKLAGGAGGSKEERVRDLMMKTSKNTKDTSDNLERLISNGALVW